MASTITFFFFFFFFFLSFSLSSSTTHHHHHHHQHLNRTHNSKPLVVSKINNSSSEQIIHQACKATRFPIPCETSLLQNHSSSFNLTTIDIINSSIQIPIQSLKTAQSMIQTITLLENNSTSSYSAKQNRSFAVKNCLMVLHYSEYRFSLVAENFPRGNDNDNDDDERIKDVRAWISAALLYQYSCWSAIKNVVYNDDMSQRINETMTFMDSLSQLTSNALSIMVSYDLFGNDTASWKPPMTERSGFWEVDHDNYDHDHIRFGGFPIDLTASVTVCKEKGDGCDYETIQAAVDAAPEENSGKRFVIRIREGVYEEIVRVPLMKKNVVFLGDGMGKTVITGSLNVGMPGISTSSSATVGVLGDGFMARDITFENTAGPDAHQAVAFRSDSDQSIFESCEFLGNQDTLYASSLRQFYNSCRIEGNVDFIFGNSATVLENCLILIRPRQISPEKGEKNAVTASGRTDPAQSTGFVFRNCVVNGTDKYMDLYDSKPKVHKNYLGRPWKEYSRTVFINCYLERLINPEGWLPWDGDFALPTLYYGELNSSGPGATNLSARVEWSSQIPVEHVNAYSLKNFIQGDKWLL